MPPLAALRRRGGRSGVARPRSLALTARPGGILGQILELIDLGQRADGTVVLDSNRGDRSVDDLSDLEPFLLGVVDAACVEIGFDILPEPVRRVEMRRRRVFTRFAIGLPVGGEEDVDLEVALLEEMHADVP